MALCFAILHVDCRKVAISNLAFCTLKFTEAVCTA